MKFLVGSHIPILYFPHIIMTEYVICDLIIQLNDHTQRGQIRCTCPPCPGLLGITSCNHVKETGFYERLHFTPASVQVASRVDTFERTLTYIELFHEEEIE